MRDKEDKEWGLPSLLLIYGGILGILAVTAGYGFTRIIPIGSDLSEERLERERTNLYERTKTAREIREVLARPLALPDPLPPITAKLANQDALNVAPSEKPHKSRTVKMRSPARNAMAMGTSADLPPSRSTPVFDRGGLGGW
jgi:hypothetical protein